jgi:hypothetical protein
MSPEKAKSRVSEDIRVVLEMKNLDPGRSFAVKKITGPECENIKVKRISLSEVKKAGTKGLVEQVRRYVYQLRADSPGIARIGRIQIEYQPEGTEKTETWESSSLEMKILPPPFWTRIKLRNVFIPVAGAAIVLLGVLLVLATRKKPKKAESEDAKPKGLEEELARLQDLKREGEYHRLVSSAHRLLYRIFREKYGLKLDGIPLDRIPARLEERDLHFDGLKRVLDLFYATKFAQFHPEENEADEVLALLKRVLQNSKDSSN